ncbi:DUF6491 family protein [Dokdonella ginsengisoli]|uniref:DUF6491 family protein n=2 Tax=Dokdonella ginsengisoli TaxID=363846 RepID=A0ABV9QPZ0_9GAMM
MKGPIAGLLLGALVLTGSAQADTPQTQKRNFERFAPYLQEPVERVDGVRGIPRWQPVGPDKIVAFTGGKKAYLLTVEAPCQALQLNPGIYVTSRRATDAIVSGADAVVSGYSAGLASGKSSGFNASGSDSCPIVEIQPIDYARMLKDRAISG